MIPLLDTPPAIATGLLDDRCGVVAGLERVPVREPWHLYQATITEPLWTLRPAGGRVAAGCSLDQRQAVASALGEAVERYCSMHADPRRLRRSTQRELISRGERAVDPDTIQFSRAASDDALSPDTECDWVQGTDRHGPVWVPAALAWTEPGPHARTAAGRPYSAPHSQGTALAAEPEHARRHGLGEVMERHALATAWHLGVPLVELDADGEIRRWFVPNRWSAPVVLATIVEPGWISAGCALGPTISRAADKAAAEAVMMSRTLAMAADDIAEPDCVEAAGALDLGAQAALCLQPEVRGEQLARLGQVSARSGSDTRLPDWAGVGPPTVGNFDPEVALATDGLEPVTIDLTTPDVAAAGWTVVRVIVPGLRAAVPAGYAPPRGGVDPLPPAPDLTPIPVI